MKDSQKDYIHPLHQVGAGTAAGAARSGGGAGHFACQRARSCAPACRGTPPLRGPPAVGTHSHVCVVFGLCGVTILQVLARVLLASICRS